MADKITNDITLLFKTKLDEKSKQEVGKNLKNLLENAAIGFDEAETKRNLEPIIRMMKRLFDKAEIAFDADELLTMPSRQALQKMADMEVGQLQLAFDKALAKSGGLKIDFGDVDLSAMTEPLERLTQELSEIGERVASTTKKSVREIENTLTSLNKTKKLDETVGHIEKTLEAVNNPKHYTTQNSATKALENARNAYTKSVESNDPWEKQYQHLLTFVSRYEAMTKKVKPLVDTDRPEFKQLYEMLSPKAGAVKISLQHLVDLRQGNELTEYKNQPWARENTLKKIEQTLRNGITVKEGSSESDAGTSDNSTPPWEDVNDKPKKPNTKVPLTDVPNVETEQQARIEAEKKAQAEIEAANAAEKRRIEEEKTVKAVKTIQIYRGVIPPEDEEDSLTRRQILDEKDGAEWWATNKNAAQTYADMDEGGAILVGTISPKNPLIIDAGGRDYDDFENMPGIKNIVDQFPQLTELIASKADITDIQKYINTRAKELGHDVVQFDNVNDVLNPSAFKELGSTFAVLDDNILEVNGAFKELRYDLEEGLGDYSKKASAENIPDYYKGPEKELQVAEDVQVASEASASAAREELEATTKTTAELEKQKKLFLYRRVEGELDPNRISSRSADALYDKHGNPSIQSALESGYGGFGDGLYAASLSGADSLAEVGKEGKTSFFEFDASDYKFYINETVEQAELIQEFLLSLQKFVGAGSILNESGLERIEDFNEEELFTAASRLFGNFDMTQEQFHTWLENAKNECQRIAELFAQGQVPEDRHNFGTRFMKELGYEGVHNATGDSYLDGEEQGTVIFDPDVDKIKATMVAFKSIDEYLAHIGQTASGAEQTVNSEITAHKENAAAIVEEARAQETLNEEKIEAQQIDAKEDVATTADKPVVVVEPVGEVEAKSSIQTEELRQLLSAITYNVKVVQDAEPAEDNKISIDEAALENVLNRITYNVKIAHDDADKTANKIAIDEGALEGTLNRVFANILRPVSETGYSAMSREDATGYISEHYDHKVWDNWYSKSIDEFRTQIAVALENDTKMRNAALNQMWDEYRHLTGKDIGFDEFLHTKIPLYRGEPSDSQSQSERALSFSLTPNTAEEFGERVLRVWMRPIDTLGMANPTYIHQPEAEVMVPKTAVPEYDKWRESLATESASESNIVDAPWAREDTLTAIRGVLEQIQANTTKAEAVEIAPASTEVGNVLATENTLAAIKTAVEAINKKVVKGTKAKTSDGGEKKSGSGKKNAESYARSQYFPEKLKTQTMQLAKFRAQLMTTGKLTDDVDAQIYELLDGLKKVQSGPDLSAWSQKFQQLKTSVGITDIFDKAEDKDITASYQQLIEFQKTRNKLELQYEKAQEGSALKQFYAEQLAQMDTVIAKQEEKLNNEEQEAKLAKLRTEQERKLGEIEAKAETKADKKRAADAKKLAKRQAMTGKAGSAIGRAESTWLEAESLEQAKLPAGFKKQVEEYYDALDKLRLKHHEINTSEVVTDKQQNELIKQTAEVNKLTSEISELVTEYQKLSGSNVNEANSRATVLTSQSGLSEYETTLKQYVREITDGKGQIKSFNAETKTLTYTVKTGKNEFTEYTAAVRNLDHQLVSVQGTTKRTETFFEATARKMKELTSYFSGMAVFNRVGQELRRGIQYIREIDLALTELKKVTDETEETYDKFLDTAAKTAEKVGSTIQKVVSSTADWARLGSILAETNIRPII